MAGCIGGLVNRLAVWFFGLKGISEQMGVKLTPQLSEGFIYAGIVWGGIWGFMFLIPLLKNRIIIRGLLFGLAPSVVMLFVVFPYWMNKGVMGVQLGDSMPLLVFIFNSIWGIVTAFWVSLTGIDYRSGS